MEVWGSSQAFLLCFFKVSILVSHMADAVCLINETYQELLIIGKKKASLSTVLIKLIARDGLTRKCPPRPARLMELSLQGWNLTPRTEDTWDKDQLFKGSVQKSN